MLTQGPANRYLKQQQRDRDGALIPSSVAAAANAVAHVYKKPIGASTAAAAAAAAAPAAPLTAVQIGMQKVAAARAAAFEEDDLLANMAGPGCS